MQGLLLLYTRKVGAYRTLILDREWKGQNAGFPPLAFFWIGEWKGQNVGVSPLG